MIRLVYEYLYFNLYQWSVKINGKEYYNNYSASLMLTLLLFVNLTTLDLILNAFTGWALPDSIVLKVIVVSLMIIISIANYRYFTYDNRYIKLIERYDSVKSRSNLVVGCMVFGSLGLLFLTSFIGLELK